jgi:NADPH2 dehydrogenase
VTFADLTVDPEHYTPAYHILTTFLTMGSVTPTAASSRLFQPLQVGKSHLQHRVALAPLTRMRATASHVPTPFMADYYAQRGSSPGTLLISEATFISDAQAGYFHAPGLFTSEQVAAWKKVTSAVHARGSFIYAQLWAHGRAARTAVMEEKGLPVIAPSEVPIEGEGAARPRAMTGEEIERTVGEYVAAARNAVEAGFDGVEIHAANGYVSSFSKSSKPAVCCGD